MTASEITQLIDKELSRCSSLENLHGITLSNIASHRLEPELKTFEDHDTPGRLDGALIEMWVVLDEKPQHSGDRYLVVYHADSGQFGLATHGGSKYPAAFHGFYKSGSFVDAVNAM